MGDAQLRFLPRPGFSVLSFVSIASHSPNCSGFPLQRITFAAKALFPGSRA